MFTYVYTSLTKFTPGYSRLPMFTTVNSCMFTYVYTCLIVFTYVYSLLPKFTCV